MGGDPPYILSNPREIIFLVFLRSPPPETHLRYSITQPCTVASKPYEKDSEADSIKQTSIKLNKNKLTKCEKHP